MPRIVMSGRFKKDLKRFELLKEKRAKIVSAIELLASGREIPPSMRPHKLIGNYAGHMELHIESDLLLIWIEEDEVGNLVIKLVRVGTHSELFGK